MFIHLNLHIAHTDINSRDFSSTVGSPTNHLKSSAKFFTSISSSTFIHQDIQGDVRVTSTTHLTFEMNDTKKVNDQCTSIRTFFFQSHLT